MVRIVHTYTPIYTPNNHELKSISLARRRRRLPRAKSNGFFGGESIDHHQITNRLIVPILKLPMLSFVCGFGILQL